MQKASRKTGIIWRQEAYPISPAHSRGPPPTHFIESLLVNKSNRNIWQTSKEEP